MLSLLQRTLLRLQKRLVKVPPRRQRKRRKRNKRIMTLKIVMSRWTLVKLFPQLMVIVIT